MSALIHWIGWAVLVSGGVMLAVALVTFVPYMVLTRCWAYLSTQKDFIAIAVRYFDEKKAKDRRIMGTPE